MPSLPILGGVGKDTMLLQTTWAKILNLFFSQSLSTPVILSQVQLASGANIVKHGLGRTLTGWQIIRKRVWESSGTITSYDVMDEQDQNLNASPAIQANATPQNTLVLYCTQGTSANPVVVDLLVF